MKLCVLLLAAVVGMALGQTAPAPAPALRANNPFQGREAVVCTFDRAPMSYCNVTTSPELYTGIEIEMFRQVAVENGYIEGQDYEFKCLDTSTDYAMADMAGNNTLGCDMAVGAISITSQRIEKGIQFPMPLYSTSLGVLVQAQPQESTGWAWTQPFSAELWIAIIVTFIGWPILVFLVEAFTLKYSITWKEAALGMSEAYWRTTWALMHGETKEVASVPARIAGSTFAFLSLIISSTYTASLATYLITSYGSSVETVADLRGRSVASAPVYFDRLQSYYGIYASDANFTNTDSIMATASAVSKGDITAIIGDLPVMEYIAAIYPGCTIFVLPNERLLPFSYGIAFPPTTDRAFVDAVSDGILAVIEGGSTRDYEVQFTLENTECTGDVATSKVTFKAVYGLWVILAAGLFVALVLMVGIRIWKHKEWLARAAQKKRLADERRRMGIKDMRKTHSHKLETPESALIDQSDSEDDD